MNHDLNNEAGAIKMSSPTTVQDGAVDLNVDSKDDSQDEVKKDKNESKTGSEGPGESITELEAIKDSAKRKQE